jgi:hypothetical protein
MVNICKEYLLEMVVSKDGENYFWPSIFKEIEDFSSTPNFVMANIIDNQEAMLNASVFILFYSRFLILEKFKIISSTKRCLNQPN